ncbi:hypothetical protein RHIZ404_230294 [Rhizobium sp. EC-SD404]|nr:hypothetical protein RHIZ404_230294 [Rhizobium sp. EC-SD404]
MATARPTGCCRAETDLGEKWGLADDQRPGAMLGVKLEQHRMGDLAVQDDDAFDARFDSLDAGLDLRDHAAGNRAVGYQRARLGDRQFLDQLAGFVEHARNVGEKQEARRVERACDGAGKGIGIDVVGVPVAARSDGGDHGDHFRFRQKVEKRTVDLDHFADKSEIENPLDIAVRIDDGLLGLLGEHHVPVLAAETDRPLALGVDERDDFLVDGPCQHHLNDLDRLLVSDAQTAFEFRFDAHLRQHRADLRSTTMDDDGIDAGLLQKRDVAGESLAQRSVAHRMSAIFDDDRAVLVALHVGECLRQQFRFDLAIVLAVCHVVLSGPLEVCRLLDGLPPRRNVLYRPPGQDVAVIDLHLRYIRRARKRNWQGNDAGHGSVDRSSRPGRPISLCRTLPQNQSETFCGLPAYSG